MTYTKKIAQNTLIQVFGKAITTVISVVMLAYLARYLGVEGYGEYTTVFAFLGFFAILADMGLYTVAVRDMAQKPESSSYIMGNIFSIRIIFALLFLILAPIVGYFVPNYSEAVKLGLWVGTLSSFFVLLNQLFVSIFQVNLRMDRYVISDVLARAILFVLVLVFIILRLDLEYFILANVIANFFLCFFSFLMSRKLLTFFFHFDFSSWIEIIKEALPLGIIIVLGLIYFKIDTIMLSLMKDSEAVGIYGAPYKILEILITLPSMFMGSVFPLISKYFHNGDPRLKNSFQKSFDFISVMIMPILVGMFLLAQPITILVLGNQFLSSALVLQYLMFAVFIIFYGTVMGNFVIAVGLQKKLLWIYAFSVLFNIIGNLVLIPSYSYIGCSISTIFTEAVVCLAAYLILYNHLKLIPGFKTFLKSIIAALIMGLVVYLFNGFNLFLNIVLGGVVYLGLLYLIGGIDKEMAKKVFSR